MLQGPVSNLMSPFFFIALTTAAKMVKQDHDKHTRGGTKNDVLTDEARMVLDPVYKQLVDGVQIQRRVITDDSIDNNAKSFYYIQ